MTEKSIRQERATKNIVWGLISKICSLALGFVSRTIFIYYIGVVFLGVNGLYTDILGVLSVAELGFGSAFTFSMYKPVADGDDEKVAQILVYYKKIYTIIAIIVLFLGLALTPFLQYIVRGAENLSSGQIQLFFLFFLANTFVNYFVSYKFNYLNAQMKNYVVTNIEMVSNIVVVLAQILFIIFFKSYIWYLVGQVGFSIICKLVTSVYLNKKYPIYKNRPADSLPVEEKRELYKNVKGSAIGQLSSAAIYSTDSIITSLMTASGVIMVGFVSNYNLIINSVTAFALILFKNLSSTFGNIVATSSKEHYRNSFYEIEFYNFWIYGFISIAFFCLIPSFITLWLGDEYLINEIAFLLIVFNVYLQGQTTAFSQARFASGNFNKDKYVSLFQAVINLVVSVICAYYFGLIGVYIGTVVSRLFFFIGRPLIMYKDMFDKNVKEYYLVTLGYLLLVVTAGVITYFSTLFFRTNTTLPNFILCALVVLIIPNTLFFFIFWKTSYFSILKARINSIIKNRR